MPSIGTRTRQGFCQERPDQGSETRTHTRDGGMSKNVTTSATFGSGKITGADGDFAAFRIGDPILVQGVQLNNGFFEVTGLDASDQAYLAVDPPPKAEGPISATVRTI